MKYIGVVHVCQLPDGRADEEAWSANQVWQCDHCKQKWIVSRRWRTNCFHLWHLPFKRKADDCVEKSRYSWEEYNGPVE